MKIKELRALGIEELQDKEKSLKKELFDLYFQRRMGSVQKPGRFKVLRRDIAKIMTLLTERANDGSKSASTTK